jgi:hypothetical protein
VEDARATPSSGTKAPGSGKAYNGDFSRFFVSGVRFFWALGGNSLFSGAPAPGKPMGAEPLPVAAGGWKGT